MIDHVLAFLQAQNEEQLYRAYLTDALKAIGENTAKAVNGAYLSVRWADIAEGRHQTDTRSGDEIAADIIKRAGLSFAGEEAEGNG